MFIISLAPAKSRHSPGYGGGDKSSQRGHKIKNEKEKEPLKDGEKNFKIFISLIGSFEKTGPKLMLIKIQLNSDWRYFVPHEIYRVVYFILRNVWV